MALPKFISIEGIEGAGKSTALLFIKDYLTQAKVEVVWTREPGGTVIGEEIRQVLLAPRTLETMAPHCELLLMFAARAQHIEQCIKPALNAGKWVVSDRYIDASYAYQGGGRGVPYAFIAAMDKEVVGETYPDLTLLMDVSPQLGVKRAESRGQEKDRIEQEAVDFFSRVREAYLARAKIAPERIAIIDASLTLQQVQEQLRSALDKFLQSNA